MIEFYEARVKKDVTGKNLGGMESVSACVMEEDVSKDSSAHAEFMTQNCVTNTGDANIASMVDNGGDASTSSLL